MWHILNYVPGPGFRRLSLPGIIDAFNSSVARPIELFAPTFVSLSSEQGKVKKTEKPLLYHYIFVRGDEADIKRLCATREGFSFVMDRASAPGAHLTVSDRSMEQFRIIAQYYGNKLPCLPLEGISLEEGDRVQIVSGDCAGLTGTYISRKGGKSGNILVAIDTTLAAIVYDVKADYVRVLEFARDSRRLYDQLDAFALRLLNDSAAPSGVRLSPRAVTQPSALSRGAAISESRKDQCSASSGVRPSPRAGAQPWALPRGAAISESRKNQGSASSPLAGGPRGASSLIPAATVFTRRLGAVKAGNPKTDARLQILLYAAYTLLGDRPNADSALEKYTRLAHNITNPWTQALSLLILGRYDEARNLLAPLAESTRLSRLQAALLGKLS